MRAPFCRCDPQAAFVFMWKALARSRNHRLVLLAWCGIAVGFLLNGSAKSSQGLHASTASAQYLVVLGPVCVVGPLRWPVVGRAPCPVGVRAPPSCSIIVPPECDVDADGAGSPCHDE